MDTELYLKREEHPTKTFGKLYNGNVYLNETLEDKVRSESEYVKSETAIPYGRYRLSISYSNRFKKQMILITNVRGGSIKYHGNSIDTLGVRIHGGNDEGDSIGCILAGKTRTETGIKDCSSVNQMLVDLVKKADETGEVYLNIVANH
ncbi:MAG: DUF5675 family protein [Bacteroidota bacterium]